VVGERPYLLRSSTVRLGGALRSENVGMSNHNSDERSEHRKPKVSLAMSISQGLGDPKGQPRGEPDGQPVNIPAPGHVFEKVRKLVIRAHYWICAHALWSNLRGVQSFPYAGGNPNERLSQKSLQESSMFGSYRKPTKVGRRKCA
jgi:hypothetical protein